MDSPDSLIANFRESLPAITLFDPSQESFTARRTTRGVLGQAHQPLAIAAPQDALQVAATVKWATSRHVAVTVRSGGNDFYGRNATDDGLVIDMRDMKSVEVASDRKTVTAGGGIITADLVTEMEEKGLVVPVGNLQILGYVGWATLGGYGPFQNLFGMGFEGIVGAEVVTAKGEVVHAGEDMLEGIRGLGGNLGIITALTVKCYPAREIFSGVLLFDATPQNIHTQHAATAKLGTPKALTLNRFILDWGGSPVLAIFFSWMDGDVPSAQSYLRAFLDGMLPSEPRTNTTAVKTFKQHMEAIPAPQAPWGGQRAVHFRGMTPTVLDLLADAAGSMPPEVNLGWTQDLQLQSGVANCFGSRDHASVTVADAVSREELYLDARKWSDELWGKLKGCTGEGVLETGFAPLTRRGERTGRQLLGEKWEGARELKGKYDPENVFRHAIPDMEG